MDRPPRLLSRWATTIFGGNHEMRWVANLSVNHPASGRQPRREAS